MGIMENFNDMLVRLAGKPYDGFDVFREFQEEKASKEARELSRRELERRMMLGSLRLGAFSACFGQRFF